jgi:hypothetical protein
VGSLAPQAAADIASARAGEPSLLSGLFGPGKTTEEGRGGTTKKEAEPRHPGQLGEIVFTDDATELAFAEGVLTL